MHLILFLASQLFLISDRDEFWNPDKLSNKTEIVQDNPHISLTEDLKHKKVLLLVHGYNNSAEEALKTYYLIHDKVETLTDPDGKKLYDIVIGYLWPGYDHKLEYIEAKENALKLAERMRKHLQFLSAKAAKLDLLVHSMGNRLVLESLNFVSLHPKRKLVQNYYALAAAVDNESIEKNNKYYISTLNCQHLYVFYSEHDEVLKFCYKIAEFDNALGYDGIENIKKLPSNVNLIDCTALISGHSLYFTAQPIYQFIMQQHLNQLPTSPDHSFKILPDGHLKAGN